MNKLALSIFIISTLLMQACGVGDVPNSHPSDKVPLDYSDENISLPIISFVNTEVSVDETEGKITLSVTVDKADNVNDITVFVNTVLGTALSDDFGELNNYKVIISAGETTQNFEIIINNDLLNEGIVAETFLVSLTSPTGAVIGSQNDVTVSINNTLVPGPNIISILPENNATDIDVSLGEINITFEDNIDDTSINTETIEVFRADASKVTGTVIYDQNTKTASFIPSTNWISNTKYTVKLNTNIKDSDGFSLAKKITSSFTTRFPLLSVVDVSVDEISENVIMSVSLNLPSGSPVTVFYSTTDNSATNGKDYEAQSSSIFFNVGETEIDIQIPLFDDNIYEENENFSVNFSNPVGILLSKNQVVVTINDNETLPTLNVANVSVNEVLSSVKLVATLSNPSKLPIKVDYVTADGTAKAGASLDYLSTNGSLNFAAGEIKQDLSITINTDQLSESPEMFNVNFSNVQGATLATSQAIVSITDNNGLPNLTMTDITVDEAAGLAVVTVKLSAVSGQTINVDYATADDSAIDGKDYTAKTGKLVFLAGETNQNISIYINNDVLYENLEKLKLILSNAVNNDSVLAANISNAQVNISIMDNDIAPVVSIENITVSESIINATLTATLTAVSGKDIIINYGTVNVAATAPGDYTSQTNSITISAGRLSNTFNIEIKNDNLYEINEQFKITFNNGNVNNGEALVTITDDDTKPELSFSDVSVSEDAVTATVTVTLSEASGVDTELTFRTVDGSAIGADDFIAISNGSLTFSAGELNATISITLKNDSIAEADEQFTIETATLIGATASNIASTITIENDDAPTPPVLSLTNGDRRVTLTWPDVQGANSYNVYFSRQSGVTPGNYAASGGTFLLSLQSGSVLTSFIQPTNLNGLKLDTSYYFVVTALAKNLESVVSIEKTTKIKIIPIEPINDTGITFGAEYPTGNNAGCIGVVINQQDCSVGRDVISNDVDGHAGFDYTKLSNNGSDLNASANSWDCVRDNVTGLIWEVKATNGLLRDSNHSYTWYSSTNNGGDAGTANGGTCFDSSNCDTEKFVVQFNKVGLCGATDWRMPTIAELESLANLNLILPAIDVNYFPNTSSSLYWSSSPNARLVGLAWYVSFARGGSDRGSSFSTGGVRLVRSAL